jgi:hypothetical protein
MTELNATICRICAQPKAAHLFCCPACWRRLGRELRAPLAAQKLKYLAPKANASAEASAKTEQRIARDNILKQQEPL